jgi:hypothetical protein
LASDLNQIEKHGFKKPEPISLGFFLPLNPSHPAAGTDRFKHSPANGRSASRGTILRQLFSRRRGNIG